MWRNVWRRGRLWWESSPVSGARWAKRIWSCFAKRLGSMRRWEISALSNPKPLKKWKKFVLLFIGHFSMIWETELGFFQTDIVEEYWIRFPLPACVAIAIRTMFPILMKTKLDSEHEKMPIGNEDMSIHLLVVVVVAEFENKLLLFSCNLVTLHEVTVFGLFHFDFFFFQVNLRVCEHCYFLLCWAQLNTSWHSIFIGTQLAEKNDTWELNLVKTAWRMVERNFKSSKLAIGPGELRYLWWTNELIVVWGF